MTLSRIHHFKALDNLGLGNFGLARRGAKALLILLIAFSGGAFWRSLRTLYHLPEETEYAAGGRETIKAGPISCGSSMDEHLPTSTLSLMRRR